MRMRLKKNLDQRLEAASAVTLENPQANKGKWNEYFGNNNPIYIEVGCGKGRFIMEHAKQNPDINYIAFERYKNVLIIPMEKVMEDKLPNLLFLSTDAALLPELFAPEEVARIYLNFSDPWPPNRQAKRRLTHKNFLNLYRQIMSKECRIEFKTDNQKLFEFSVMEFANEGFILSNLSLDLHKTDLPNIQTEYEQKFAEMGQRIYRVEASL